jgi:hypothetical protein
MVIIPQEESKQDYSGVHIRHCYQGEYEDGCKYGEDDCPAKPYEPKQETLEEAAHKMLIDYGIKSMGQSIGVLEVQKLMVKIAERMYSEEDMIEFAFNTYHYISELMGVEFNKISENKLHAMYNFEQFKKKVK